MTSPIGNLLLAEQEEWATFVAGQCDCIPQLISVSPLDSDRRVYRCHRRSLKIRRLRGEAQDKRQFGQTLTAEYQALLHASEHGFCDPPSLSREPGWEVLQCNYVNGTPLSSVWPVEGWWRRTMFAVISIRIIFRLNCIGIYHGDLSSTNFIVTEDGAVQLIDFGDARITSPVQAVINEWKRFLFGRHGLLLRSLKTGLLRAFPATQTPFRRWKMRNATPLTLETSDPDYRELSRVWQAASRWNSTEGQWLAYSSLTVGGEHFPGQRPWLLRWTRIREHVSFRGKRVVDLGCNMGLLTSFAMLEGAKSATGIEGESQLVQAARDLAAVLGVDSQFLQADLDGPDLEELCRGADIVVAMSIFEWVEDKQRLLRIFSNCDEILYEGHDPLPMEKQRLRSAGFTTVIEVIRGDRGRTVLYDRKGIVPTQPIETSSASQLG